MFDVNANVSAETSKASGLLNGLFSNLGINFKGNTAGSNLFSSLLTQVSNGEASSLPASIGDAIPRTNIPTTSSQNTSGSSPASTQSTTPPTSETIPPSWHALAEASHNYMSEKDKIKGHQEEHKSKKTSDKSSYASHQGDSTPKKTQASTVDSGTESGSTVTAKTTPSASMQSMADNSGTGGGSAATGLEKATTDLLAQLQGVVQWLDQKLKQAAKGSASGANDPTALAASSPSGDAASTKSPISSASLPITADLPALTTGTASPNNLLLMDPTKLASTLQSLLGLVQTISKDVDSKITPGQVSSSSGDVNVSLNKFIASLKSILTNDPSISVNNANTTVPSLDAASSSSSSLASKTSNSTVANLNNDIDGKTAAFMQELGDRFSQYVPPGVVPSADLPPLQTTGGTQVSNDEDPLMGEASVSAPENTLETNIEPLPSSLEGNKSSDPYAFASQLSASRLSSGLNIPSPVEQVMFQLSRSAKVGQSQMTMQLQPTDLGQINVKLDFSSDGKVQGTVIADNPATLDLLLKNVRSLERGLQDAGFSADPGSLQFSLGGQQKDTSNQTASNNGRDNAGSSNSFSSSSLVDSAATVTNETYYITPGRVNLQV